MFDRMRHGAEVDDFELDDLASELRVAGLLTPTPQPTPARRAELRAAVLARRNERSRAGVGGIRGAALGVAMAAGSGLVIASAAGGGNPVTFVAEVVRDIPVPEARPVRRERPSEPRPAVAASPEVSPTVEHRAAEATTPTPLVRSVAADAGATVVREATEETPVATPASRPSKEEVKQPDTAPALSAVKPAEAVRPTTTTAASNADPGPSSLDSTETRTQSPSVTATSTPKPATDLAPITNTGTWPIATPTPASTRPMPTTNTTDPLKASQPEKNDYARD